MQSVTRAAMTAVLVTSALATLHQYKPSQKRQLYAFPRVGRSEGVFRMPSHVPMTLEQLLLEHSRTHENSKRATEIKSEKDPGMWFGPRLGRSFKQDIENERDSPAPYSNESSEPEEADQTDQADQNRQKRQVQ